MKKAILEIDGRRIPVIIDEDNITCSGYERGNVYVEEHKQHITLLPEKDDTPTARELKNQLFDVGLLYSSEKIAKANMRADTLNIRSQPLRRHLRGNDKTSRRVQRLQPTRGDNLCAFFRRRCGYRREST